MVNEFDRYGYAQRLFEQKKYTSAAKELEAILGSDQGRGRGDVRELHMRALFHSAQLRGAESAAREILADNPTDAYAMVVLGRSLYRQGRYEEAEGYLRQAEAFGAQTI